MFYDPEFNFRKQIVVHGQTRENYETTLPFRKNLLLIETDKQSDPEKGVQLRLIDSTISLRKKVVILLPGTLISSLCLISEVSIYRAIMKFGLQGILKQIHPISILLSILSPGWIATSMLYVSILGFDNKYRIFGLRVFESGGAIVFGSRVRDGLSINEGEDIFAIRVGENW